VKVYERARSSTHYEDNGETEEKFALIAPGAPSRKANHLKAIIKMQ